MYRVNVKTNQIKTVFFEDGGELYMGWYASTIKSTLQEKVKEMADTVLHEEAMRVIKQVEQNKSSSNELCHTLNSIIYQEAHRRNKADQIWMDAYNRVQNELGAKIRTRN